MQNLLSTLANWAQIVAVILATVALLIEIRHRRLNRPTRALGYGFYEPGFPVLIRANEDYRENIKIHYKGRSVTDIFILQAVLRNTGNLPIRRSHIVQPIRFTFGPDIELLDVPMIINKTPEDLTTDLEFDEINLAEKQAIGLDFDLLNPNDEITVQFVGSGQLSLPLVTGRVEGVSSLEKLDPSSSKESNRLLRNSLPRPLLSGFMVLLFFVSAVLLSSHTFGNPVDPLDYFTGLGTGFVIAGLLAAISNQIRLARLQLGQRNRQGLIQFSRGARFSYMVWIIAQVVFVSIVCIVIILILQQSAF